MTPRSGSGPVRVVLADDQAVVRDGLAMLLSAADDLDVVATAVDGTRAVEVVLAERPDVAVVDLRMPGLDGAQVTASVRRDAPEVRVLILTTYADDDAVLPALRAGAAGYLTKDTTGEALLAAIRTVAAGGSVLDTAVQRRLVDLAGSPAPSASLPAPEPDLPEGLTRPGGRRAASGRPGSVEPADRLTARRQRGHREDPRQPPDLQARRRRQARPGGLGVAERRGFGLTPYRPNVFPMMSRWISLVPPYTVDTTDWRSSRSMPYSVA